MLSELHSCLARRWSAILSTPSGPKLLFSHLAFCREYHSLHICQDDMSGKPRYQEHQGLDSVSLSSCVNYKLAAARYPGDGTAGMWRCPHSCQRGGRFAIQMIFWPLCTMAQLCESVTCFTLELRTVRQQGLDSHVLLCLTVQLPGQGISPLNQGS